MDNIETLLERFIDDRDQLSDEELDALVAAAQRDTSIASTLKDQLVIDELLAQRLAVDRRNFVAQIGQRIRDEDATTPTVTAEDGDVAGEMRQLLDVELSKHQHEARRRQSSHWRIALALMLLLVASGGVWWWWQTQLQPLAIVEHVHGAPKLVRGSGVRTLQVGDVLRSDDTLTTAPEEEAALRYSDGTELRLAGDTSVTFLGEESSQGKRVNLSWGTVIAEVVPQPVGRPMVLTTPLSSATVRGTRLWLSGDPDSTRLDVIEGVVELKRLSDGEVLPVKSREYAVATAEEFAVQPLAWPIDRRDAAVLLETADTTTEVRDVETGRYVPLDLRPQGKARLDHDFAFVLSGGSYALYNASAAVLQSCQRTGELTIETTITPQYARQSSSTCIVGCSAGGEKYNFELGQQGDLLVLRLQTSDELAGDDRNIELCRLVAGQPQHVVVAYRPGELVCYLNGRRIYHDGRLSGDFRNWQRYAVTVGDNQRGQRDWAGTLEGLAIYDRFLGDDEVLRNAELYREMITRRPKIPQVEIAATLLEKSPVPAPDEVQPSVAALVVCRYRVDGILRGELSSDEVLVAQWAVLDGQPQSIASMEVGQKRQMTLERLGPNAQLAGVVRVDEFRKGDDPNKPRYYEVSDP